MGRRVVEASESKKHRTIWTFFGFWHGRIPNFTVPVINLEKKQTLFILHYFLIFYPQEYLVWL